MQLVEFEPYRLNFACITNRNLLHNRTVNLDRPLSTLELTTLGIVYKKGPCVANAVVTEIAESKVYAFTSGAGSIYQLLKRLHAAGLLLQSQRRYSLSEFGIQALRTWLRPPFEADEFSPTLDPIRSRVTFLGLLSQSELDEFTSKTMEGLNLLLDQCSQDLDAHRDAGDKIGELALLGAVRETQARIMWISEVRRVVLDPGYSQYCPEATA